MGSYGVARVGEKREEEQDEGLRDEDDGDDGESEEDGEPEEDEEEDDDNEEEQDDDSDVSEESASHSSEGSEYLEGGAKCQPAMTPSSVYYLVGNGSTNCSKELWTPWVNGGEDIAGVVWGYREMICRKAKNLEPLFGSVEKL